MLEARELVQEYQGRRVVDHVSFRLRPGEISGYLGPNGAGKSTTVKILAGLLRPVCGEVFFDGVPFSENSLQAKRQLGYVPESAALYTSLTANEYFSLVAELYHLERTHAVERIRQLTSLLDLAGFTDRQIGTLSKGQKQKVLLIGALLHDPRVLLLDEPLNGLDVNAVAAFRGILEEMLRRGSTILFCSHILEVVERMCPRIILIHQGKILADEPTPKLLARTREGTLEAAFRALTK